MSFLHCQYMRYRSYQVRMVEDAAFFFALLSVN